MKRVIQVGGTDRSGTTLLGLILANDFDAIALGEVMHLFSPTHKDYRKKISNLKRDNRWADIIKDKPENLYHNIFEMFPKVNLITDSSKDPFWFKKTGGKSKIYDIIRIVSYKTPAQLKKSYDKRGFDNWHTVYVNYYRRYITLIPTFRSVFLDSLLSEPDTIKVLCQFCEVKYHKARLNYWEKEQPNFFGSPTAKKNKIDLDNKSIDEDVNISTQLQIIYDFLRSVDIIIRNVKNPENEINSLKYNRIMIELLNLRNLLSRKLNV